MTTPRFLRVTALAGLLLAGLLTVSLIPAAAQGDGLSAEARELLAYVVKAFDLFALQDTYHLNMDYHVEQVMSTSLGGTEIEAAHNVIHQVIDGVVVQVADPEPATAAIDMTLVQEMIVEAAGQSETTVNMTMGMIMVDGDIYARITEFEPLTAGLVPSGWVNWSENPESLPGGNMLDFEGMVDVGSQILLYPLNLQTVAAIREIEPAAEAGEGVRAFELSLDSAGVAAVAGDALAGMFNTSAFPGDAAAMLQAMLEQMTIDITLHVDANTHLLVMISSETAFLVELTAEMTGSVPILMDQVTTVIVKLSEFGAPVTIEAPEVD